MDEALPRLAFKRVTALEGLRLLGLEGRCEGKVYVRQSLERGRVYAFRQDAQGRFRTRRGYLSHADACFEGNTFVTAAFIVRTAREMEQD